MFTSTETYSPAISIRTRFMPVASVVRGCDQRRLHADADITLAGRSVR